MTENNAKEADSARVAEREEGRRGVGARAKAAILVVAILFVVMPFLFWRSTWFGLPLSDQELGEAFADREHPRKIQHALSQIADRIVRGDASVRRWYPQVRAAALHSTDEIRLTAAWVMGLDTSAEEFRSPLLALLQDENPMVRHNAALALVRFGDASGREDILTMLRPHQLTAPAAGTLVRRLVESDAVNPGTLVGRIRQGDTETEIRSKVPGTLERWLLANESAVSAGTPIVEIAPSAEMVWEALRALALVGTLEDLPLVESYFAPREGLPPQVNAQARATARAIRQRVKE